MLPKCLAVEVVKQLFVHALKNGRFYWARNMRQDNSLRTETQPLPVNQGVQEKKHYTAIRL